MFEFSGAIDRCDFVRRSPWPLGGPGGHKEWHHFAILTAEIDLLVNFSMSDNALPGAKRGDEVPRIVVLLRAGTWDGDVESYDAGGNANVVGGGIDLSFAGNRLGYADGHFSIWVVARERPIAIDLKLEPLTAPAFVPNVGMLDGPPLHWVVVPRLRARGEIKLGSRRIDLTGALAYHDHNWGHFLWGHDVSWEWGFVLPEDPDVPWSVTFVRLTNRARTEVLAQKVLVWSGSGLARAFREESVRFVPSSDYLRPTRLFKVPRAMALVAPETCCDVPRAIRVSAGIPNHGPDDPVASHLGSGRDWIDISCDMGEVGQVLIPSETELGVTIFNEVTARTTVAGCIGGESLAYTGRSILEFIRG
jgi:hypothetical protein